MDEYTKQLIEGARATYHDVVAGKDNRIQHGAVLWDLFKRAADGCRADAKGSERQLAERINELAMAKVLADDKGLRGRGQLRLRPSADGTGPDGRFRLPGERPKLRRRH
jgi:hypothetical protein